MQRARVGVLAALFLSACAGGRGGLPGEEETWDPAAQAEGATITTDRGAVTNERATSTNEAAEGTASPSASSSNGGGGVDCSGRYACITAGSSKSDNVTFRAAAGGGCTVDDGVLEADGRVTSKGRPIGTWSQSGNVLTISSEKQLTCTKVTTAGSSNTSSSSSSDGAPASPPRP